MVKGQQQPSAASNDDKARLIAEPFAFHASAQARLLNSLHQSSFATGGQ
jgi:hypothetical protein